MKVAACGPGTDGPPWVINILESGADGCRRILGVMHAVRGSRRELGCADRCKVWYEYGYGMRSGLKQARERRYSVTTFASRSVIDQL